MHVVVIRSKNCCLMTVNKNLVYKNVSTKILECFIAVFFLHFLAKLKNAQIYFDMRKNFLCFCAYYDDSMLRYFSSVPESNKITNNRITDYENRNYVTFGG